MKTDFDLQLSMYNTCFIHERNRRLICWGSVGHDYLRYPKLYEKNVYMVSLSFGHMCAISNINYILYCWGYNKYGQTNVPQMYYKSIMVGTGMTHSCSLNSDHKFGCWGKGSIESQGIEYNIRVVPKEVNKEVLGFSIGGYHICVFQEYNDGKSKITDPKKQLDEIELGTAQITLVCWGCNEFGQSELPEDYKQVLSLIELVDIQLGHGHTCAIVKLTMRCWGQNENGQSSVPAAGLFRRWVWAGVALGYSHSCGMLPTLTLKCWGSNEWGQLDVPEGFVESMWNVGGDHTCRFDSKNVLRCWGRNDYYQTTVPAIL